MTPISRYGAVVERMLLPVVYYLHRFALSASDREEVLRKVPRPELQDFLAAVRPYVTEIDCALEAEDTNPIERSVLEDFAETYEAALAWLGISLERVKANWDVVQVTGDRAVNRALLEILRGKDLRGRGGGQEADLDVVRGWGRLHEIRTRRTLHLRVLEVHDEVRQLAADLFRLHEDLLVEAPELVEEAEDAP